MFTPQRLFGEIGAPSSALSYEPFLERARVQREQDSDASARLALGGYVVARLIDKLLLLDDDAELLEAFRWQLLAVRRHVGDLPGDSPETAHLAGIVAAVPEQGTPASSLWMSLTAYAYFLEHEGRLDEALDVVSLASRVQGTSTATSDFVTYALLAGRLNRLLARWDAAARCYTVALDAASASGDPIRGFKARLGHAHVLRARGDLPRARAEVELVLSEAAASELRGVQGEAQQDLGIVLMLQGLRSESLSATYEAFRLTEDTLSRMRILGDLGYGLSETGHYGAARLALEIVVGSRASYLVKLNALLELMQLESADGNRVAFERRRNEAKQLAERMTPSMAVDYRYKTAVGLARFGQIERARQILSEALELAEKHALNEWYFRLERMQSGLSDRTEVDVTIKAPAEACITPAVRQMADGLREYAASAT